MHYIRHLGEYAAGIPDGVNLGLSDIQVTYVCQGGMTLRPRAGNRWIRDHLTEVTSSCPSVIVLHIGENDLGSLPASEVAGEILQLAWDFRRDYRCPVYVTTPGLAASFTREITGRRGDQHRTASHLA